MDVHPPHQPIHSWRDFFLHLITITIGLLIALGLEGVVEWSHHRHLVHEARATIRHELAGNAKTAAQDAQWLREDEQRLQQDIGTLLSLRSGKKLEHAKLEYEESWNSMSDSAWQTAHSSGALNYMDYSEAQNMADVYGQQEIVNREGVHIYSEHTLAVAPVFISNNPNEMTREEIELCLQRSADLLLKVRSLEQIISDLQHDYEVQLKRME